MKAAAARNTRRYTDCMKHSNLAIFAVALLAPFSVSAGIVDDVRDAFAHNNVAAATAALDNYKSHSGVTPEYILAVSWMGRGLLARKDYTGAEKYARDTYQLATNALKSRPLDQEPQLPTALGASIEVQANVLAASGDRAQAVSYLQAELRKYDKTSMHARIQKNILLLSLEGKPAPAIAGVTLPKGKPVVLFFWAHWCPDCKQEAPILKTLRQEFGPKGLAIVPVTQKYGYVANGDDAPPAVEVPYIEKVRQEYYSAIVDPPAKISEEAFRLYGASSTPTLVLVDKNGIVRNYHPGAMTYEELRSKILTLL
jgi:thiol-disulfide isomerase/thioredoxin